MVGGEQGGINCHDNYRLDGLSDDSASAIVSGVGADAGRDGMNRILDLVLPVLHGILVLFNLTGWAWRRTRRAHLVSITATLLSWTLLGLLYGFGYCPLTDWHWQIKRSLGERDLPASYVKYYLDRATGLDWDPTVVDVVVVVPALVALGLSLWLNLRTRRRAG